MVKITYKDISPTAKENSSLSTTDKKDFVELNELKQELSEFPKYMTLEKDFTILDGTFDILPTNTKEAVLGLWSDSMTDEEGNFATPPVLTVSFTAYQTSTGITIRFHPDTDDYCNSLNIKWYQDNTLLDDQDYTPDSGVFFCQNNVTNFNKVVITFNSTNKPVRFLKVQQIEYGAIRTFEEEDLRNVNILEEISLVTEEITIDTLNFTLDNIDNIDFIFQKKQPLSVQYGSNLMGTFFIESSKRVSKTVYEIEATDYLGLLDKSYFEGGTYSSVTASSLIASIMGTIPYELDSTLGAKTLSGTLERCTRREALLQVVFAICGVVSTARSDKVRIYSLSNTSVGTIVESNIFTGASFEGEDEVTGIRLTLNNETVVSKKNPIVTQDTPEKILEFGGVFVDSSNSTEILNNLYTHFVERGQQKSNVKFKFTTEKVGDKIDYATEYLGSKSGYITSMKYNLNTRNLVGDTENKEV